jgi:glucose-1-phosphate cytidylyltransferase
MEGLLMEDLKNYQAAILCGGRGKRLRPTTDVIPKALVELNGKPIIDYIIDFYKSKGIRNFILCTGYKGEQIKSHCDTYPAELNLQFSDAGENASMLQRIWQMRDQITDRIFISYCDTFIDLDIGQMLEEHIQKGVAATMVTAKIRSPFGLLTYDEGGWVDSFTEKPTLNYYIGSFILERTALEYVTDEMLDKPDGGGIVQFFKTLVDKRQLASFEHSGTPMTFNTENERQEAEQLLGHYYTISEDA